MPLKVITCFLCLYSMLVFADDYYLMLQFERQKSYQSAVDYFAQIENKNTDLEIVMARIYMQKGCFKKAENLLKHVIEKKPYSSDGYLLLSGVLESQANYEQALQYVDRGLLVNPFEWSFYPKKYELIRLLTPSKDVDAALKQSQLLFQTHQYQAGIDLLLPYISDYPDYTDLRLGIIHGYMYQKRYQLALVMCEQGLKHEPHQVALIKKQQDLYRLLASKHVPHPQTIQKVVEEKRYLNELGVFEQLYYISDKRQGFDYTSAFYGRETPLGKLYGRVNYASRLKKEANQYAVEFFPKLGKYVYLDLYAGFANQPLLFPNYSYSGEAFVVLPKLFDFSLGGQFNRIVNDFQYSRFTVSISKNILTDLSLTFKPYFYFPGSGDNSILYTMSFRHMLKEPWVYWGMMVGTGTTPDLANFETVNFLVLKNPIILSPYLNFSLFHDQFLINTSFLFQRQLFPEQYHRTRDWIGGTLGVTWRF